MTQAELLRSEVSRREQAEADLRKVTAELSAARKAMAEGRGHRKAMAEGRGQEAEMQRQMEEQLERERAKRVEHRAPHAQVARVRRHAQVQGGDE